VHTSERRNLERPSDEVALVTAAVDGQRGSSREQGARSTEDGRGCRSISTRPMKASVGQVASPLRHRRASF